MDVSETLPGSRLILSRSVGLSLYNCIMKNPLDLINNRLGNLMEEIDMINSQKEAYKEKLQELDIRTHQLVGAVYELQSLLHEVSLVNQPSEKPSTWRPEDPFETADWTRQSPHPSEGADLNIHQEQPLETEKNSQQPS